MSQAPKPKAAAGSSLLDGLKKAIEEGKATLAVEALALPSPTATAPGTTPNPVALVRQQQCLLLDVSASMIEDVEPGCSKWEALRRLLPQFLGTRRFAFSSDCRAVVDLPRPHGSTDLAGAFAHLRQHGIRHAVLITDGLPDSEEAALREAKGLRLDIFYVGPPPRPDFLDRLARACGGTAHSGQLDPRGRGRIAAAAKQILALPPGKD